MGAASTKLQSLSGDQLCALLDHCHMSDLKVFVTTHNLTGVDLEGGIDSANDLEKLGLPWLKAKLLYNKINTWKTHGLPSNFSPPPVVPHVVSHSSPVLEPSPVQNIATTLAPALDASASALKLAADQGDVVAQRKLGVCYFCGDGVRVDFAEAAKYYQLAAGQNDVFAQYHLGQCYYHGKGVSVDYAEAVKYYKMAAGQGDAGAQHCLGTCYEEGKGVSVDHVAAVKYYTLAAEQGHTDALFNLGTCYKEGKGVRVDNSTAVKYLRLAVDKGHPYAHYSLTL